jgi:hypothetical protein
MKVYIQPIYDSNKNEIGVIISEKNMLGVTEKHKEVSKRNIIDFIKDRYYPEIVTFNYFSDVNFNTSSVIAIKNDSLNRLTGADNDI